MVGEFEELQDIFVGRQGMQKTNFWLFELNHVPFLSTVALKLVSQCKHITLKCLSPKLTGKGDIIRVNPWVFCSVGLTWLDEPATLCEPPENIPICTVGRGAKADAEEGAAGLFAMLFLLWAPVCGWWQAAASICQSLADPLIMFWDRCYYWSPRPKTTRGQQQGELEEGKTQELMALL